MALTRLSLAHRATASLLWPCCAGSSSGNWSFDACAPYSRKQETRSNSSHAVCSRRREGAPAERFGARHHASLAPPPDSASTVVAGTPSSAKLSRSHIGKYYPIDEARIPEAFDQWYSNRDRRAGRSVPIDGGGAIQPLPSFVAGCTGLQHELALSRYPYLMYRSAYATVWDMIINGTMDDDRRVLVKGANGCGKSVFLSATAEYLRQNGWIVMYVPDCSDITWKNMSYSQNPETEMYDTRDAAQNILRSVLEAHGDALKALPQQVEGGSGSLYDLACLDDTATDVRLCCLLQGPAPGPFLLAEQLCEHDPAEIMHLAAFAACSSADGMDARNAALCNAVVRLKLELYHLPRSTPSAVILDNYNSLFWRTDMFAPERLKSKTPPRRLDAQELTLGANLRVLSDGDTGSTAVIAACSVSGAVPRLPVLHGCSLPLTQVTLPLLAAQEVAGVLQWYRHVHAISPKQAISETGTKAAWQLTQGSGTAIRRNLHFLLPYSKELEDLDALGEQYADVSLYR